MEILRVDDGETATLPKHPCIRIDANGLNKYIVWAAEKEDKSNIYFNALNNRDIRVFESDIQINDEGGSDNATKPYLDVRPGGGGGLGQINFCIVII